MKNPKTIRSLFAFPGFVAVGRLSGVFGDRYARVIRLNRRKKQRFVHTVGHAYVVTTIGVCAVPEICWWRVFGYTWNSSVGVSGARGVAACT